MRCYNLQITRLVRKIIFLKYFFNFSTLLCALQSTKSSQKIYLVFWTSKLFPDTSIIIIPLNKCRRIVKKGFWSFNYRAVTTFQGISSTFCTPKFILIHMDEDTKLCYQIQLRLIFWSISYRKTCVVLLNISNKGPLEEKFSIDLHNQIYYSNIF